LIRHDFVFVYLPQLLNHNLCNPFALFVLIIAGVKRKIPIYNCIATFFRVKNILEEWYYG
jgi:hypothetical protein